MPDRFIIEMHANVDHYIVRDTLTNTIREVCQDLEDAEWIRNSLEELKEGYNLGKRFPVAA